MSQANDPNLRFSSDHAYVKVEDGEASIGLTYFGQDHTSRVTFISLPQVGQKLAKDQPFATIEAVKATIDVPTPVNGEVLAVNDTLKADPWLINTDPYGKGWMIRVHLEEPSQLDQLMDEDTYKASAVWNCT
jgi:glycine cleavage system H protein